MKWYVLFLMCLMCCRLMAMDFDSLDFDPAEYPDAAIVFLQGRIASETVRAEGLLTIEAILKVEVVTTEGLKKKSALAKLRLNQRQFEYCLFGIHAMKDQLKKHQ